MLAIASKMLAGVTMIVPSASSVAMAQAAEPAATDAVRASGAVEGRGVTAFVDRLFRPDYRSAERASVVIAQATVVNGIRVRGAA